MKDKLPPSLIATSCCYENVLTRYFCLVLLLSQVNVVVIMYLYVFPQSQALLGAVWLLSHGPLAFAIVTWRNSLVLHRYSFPLILSFSEPGVKKSIRKKRIKKRGCMNIDDKEKKGSSCDDHDVFPCRRLPLIMPRRYLLVVLFSNIIVSSVVYW